MQIVTGLITMYIVNFVIELSYFYLLKLCESLICFHMFHIFFVVVLLPSALCHVLPRIDLITEIILHGYYKNILAIAIFLMCTGSNTVIHSG
jgi:hypothetical protein